ncbi:MAG: hypothetical protein ACOZNI_16150 [Myxococcota bacterium]
MTPALADVSEGDLRWWRGDRGGAVAEYRAALAAADGSPEGLAAETMARIRLLQLSGNLAPFVHEPKLDRALAACPRTSAWCRLAEADAELFLPAFTGADPGRVAALLRGDDGGPARARRVAAGEDPTLLRDRDDLDGMGLGIRETGRLRPASPGTWVLNLGVGGAPGAGVGGLVRFVHPDVGWRADRLDVLAGGDTRGGAFVSGAFARPGRWSATATAARAVGDAWLAGEPYRYEVGTLRASAAWIPARRGVSAQVGASARADRYGEAWYAVAGPLASVTIGDRVAYTRLGADVGFGDYTHLAVSSDTRAYPAVLGGTLATRALLTHVPTRETPFFRLPSAGGTDLLRGEPAGRYRDDTVFGGQAEYRRVVHDPVGVAVFADVAWVDAWHATLGGGVRLVLPPAETNTTRLDVGWSPETGAWGVVAAWGEAF